MCDINSIETYGRKPKNIQWNIVRGDTSSLKIDFFDLDESTYWDTDDWTYVATSYDSQGDILDELTVTPYSGYVLITAPADLTAYWGTKYTPVVAELPFDLQATIPTESGPITWTPVLGTIRVLGDISPGSSL
jgi:hypothetical protein